MNSSLKIISAAFLILLLLFAPGCGSRNDSSPSKKILGWNILSSDKSCADKTIAKAVSYGVNHLQLSHEIIHDLREIKNPEKQKLVNELTAEAHGKGIPEVVVWDHALYDLDYYPGEFKSAEGGKIDLDNPEFWEWLKQDYRKMLDLAPDINGIVLTFIETGARVEDQYSAILNSPEDKLAELVNNIASVVIEERNLNLYIRDFSYNRTELASVLKCIDRIQNSKVVVMCKEVPHDFFITHPVAWWIQDIKLPVIIEFDCAHEFNGQNVVASIFPEIHFNRWEYYQTLPNVIGFSIRTDRYGNTSIIDRAGEINLFAVHSLTEDPSVNIETIYNNFISEKYGESVLSPLKMIFKRAPEIITSIYYTLGLNTAKHSSLNFDYRSIYTRHVSGRWMDNPTISINHGINKDFHYWIDIVNHLAPPEYKVGDKNNLREIPEVLSNRWIQPVELMDEEYLSYVIKEKNYGLRLAAQVLELLQKFKNEFKNQTDYRDLYNTFERTELSARLFTGVAKVYYGSRIYGRGNKFRTAELIKNIASGLNEIKNASGLIRNYSKPYPVGQYDWKKDAEIAMEYYNNISGSELGKIARLDEQ